jgi:hypothetical protein
MSDSEHEPGHLRIPTKAKSMQSQQERLQEMVDYLLKHSGPDSPLAKDLQQQIVSLNRGRPRPNPMGEDRYLAGFKKGIVSDSPNQA